MDPVVISVVSQSSDFLSLCFSPGRQLSQFFAFRVSSMKVQDKLNFLRREQRLPSNYHKIIAGRFVHNRWGSVELHCLSYTPWSSHAVTPGGVARSVFVRPKRGVKGHHLLVCCRFVIANQF